MVINFYRRMVFKYYPTMLTQNELEPFCARFDLTNLTNFDKINPIPIKGKQIKRKEEKLHDGRWRFIIPHKILVITDSHPLDYLFPHNFISNAIDDDKKITGELLGCDSCENNLPPYLYVTEERDPRGVLSIIIVSRYWIAFFIKTSTAWAG